MAKRLKHKIANIELSKLVSLLGKIFIFLYFETISLKNFSTNKVG